MMTEIREEKIGINEMNKNVIGYNLNIRLVYYLIKTSRNDKISQNKRCLCRHRQRL